MTRSQIRRAAALAFAACGVLLGACSDGGDEGRRSTSTTDGGATSSSSAAGDWERCVAPTFTIERAPGWHANDASEAPPCRWFDDEPFNLPENTEAPGIAVSASFQPGTAAELAGATTGVEVLERSEEQIDGRLAIRVLRRSTGEALLPAGTRSLSWFLATEPRSFLLSTNEVGSEADFEAHVEVLDRMARSFRLTAPIACSAAGREAPDPPDGIPADVASTFRDVRDAALACDLDRLASVAREGDQEFTASFGGNEPQELWREGEMRGDRPLEMLVLLLGLDHATADPGDTGRIFVWPAAATKPWREVGEAERSALRTLYRLQDLESYDEAGAYLGFRVGIAADGEWMYFVAGD